MRNIYIAVAVMACILFPGALLLQHAGGVANGAFFVVVFTIPLIVLHALEDRPIRQKRDD
jgi:preprotein translocase subunit SecG